MLTEKEVQEKLESLIYQDVIDADELKEFVSLLDKRRDKYIIKEFKQLFYDMPEDFVLIDSQHIETYYQIKFEECTDTSNIPKEYRWMLKHIDWESVVMEDFTNGSLEKYEFFNREFYVEER